MRLSEGTMEKRIDRDWSDYIHKYHRETPLNNEYTL
jgi:hypothetical protein